MSRTAVAAPPRLALTIEPEPAKALPMEQERALLRQAIDRQPATEALRRGYVSLSLLLDAFDDVIALGTPLAEDTGAASDLLAVAIAYMSRDHDGDMTCADGFAARAAAAADEPKPRAAALALHGKIRTLLGDRDGALTLLEAALEADPANVDAAKRRMTLLLRRGQPDTALAVADALRARGANHARLLAAMGEAHAMLGDLATARSLIGVPDFLVSETLPVPDGWSSLEGFNADLSAELNGHANLRYGRYGVASSHSWRVDRPATGRVPANRALRDAITARVLDAARRHDAIDHPWVATRPDRAIFHNWSVLTDAEGYEEWHVHQGGWMSGVYYVDVPDAIVNGTGREGCIAFGLPDDPVDGAIATAYGETLVRPRSGMLLLFPSQAFHRTFPHGGDRRRICVAFDIVPA
ncbi:putative 2OG-Fe(II) oxygenase [Sphingomonas donggukensis]|uniref:2OG-Fe(II) oxygenase n=1 Tax=Sphingomonas donggukensis TaxID=2949093 RepID=A0ABY4TTJ6_9SPHN|nr:putative 2OG-Fe(II) oxygenase [Sphingomonas donggukensis]URW75160.1 putative 2OG-Fe(II) oxygenase [Sphingomonas donggukensis]